MIPTARAEAAWADYLAMGDGRTLEALLDRYRTVAGAPSHRLNTLKAWSSAFDWQGRLKRIALESAERAAAALDAKRRAVLEDGFALDYERLIALKRLAGTLLDELESGGRLWVDDVKVIGFGRNQERVDIERFNSAEVSEFRGLLDDIAKEVGARQRKVDVTTAGQPIKAYIGIDPDSV